MIWASVSPGKPTSGNRILRSAKTGKICLLESMVAAFEGFLRFVAEENPKPRRSKSDDLGVLPKAKESNHQNAYRRGFFVGIQGSERYPSHDDFWGHAGKNTGVSHSCFLRLSKPGEQLGRGLGALE